MSPNEDLNDILRNFVDKDLASLDRVGGETESYTLSPHLTQPSPDLALTSPVINSTTDSGNDVLKGPTVNTSAVSGSVKQTPDPVAFSTPQNANVSGEVKSETVSEITSDTQLGTVKPRQSGSEPNHSTNSGTRHVSTNSTASVSTLEKEKRQSFGDKFKAFGKRITSGSSRK